MAINATLVLHNIGELATCDVERGSAPGVIRNAVIAARDDVIVAVGDESLRNDITLMEGGVTIDVRGNAAIPGFVDSHSHIVWLGDRGDEYGLRASGTRYEEIAAQGGGIRSTVHATAAGSSEDLQQAAARRARRMLRFGTTTVEVKSGYGLDTAAEMRQLHAANALRNAVGFPDIVTTYLPFHARPDGDRAAFVDTVITDGLAQARGRAHFVDAFCEVGAFTVDECERLFVHAKDHGFGIKIHAEQLTQCGGAQLAARVGARSADHLEHSTDDDHRALAKAGVVATILPGAALVLGGPFPPGRSLIDAGATVAIATDCNPGTCYSESMPLMVSIAVAMCGLTPAEALIAATRSGAAALGLADRGVIKPGARCDVAMLRSNHWIDVAYHLGGDVVEAVVRSGRVVG